MQCMWPDQAKAAGHATGWADAGTRVCVFNFSRNAIFQEMSWFMLAVVTATTPPIANSMLSPLGSNDSPRMSLLG